MAAAGAEADRAADAYLGMLTLAQTLDAEIAAAEQELEDLAAQAERLRAQLQERAAQAYLRSGSTDIEFGLDSDEAALETARRTTLLNRLNESDNEVAEKLAEVTDSLETRRTQLRADRAAHEETLARLREEQAAVDAKLAEAQAAVQRRGRGRGCRRRRSGRSCGG